LLSPLLGILGLLRVSPSLSVLLPNPTLLRLNLHRNLNHHTPLHYTPHHLPMLTLFTPST